MRHTNLSVMPDDADALDVSQIVTVCLSACLTACLPVCLHVIALDVGCLILSCLDGLLGG